MTNSKRVTTLPPLRAIDFWSAAQATEDWRMDSATAFTEACHWVHMAHRAANAVREES